MTYDIRFWARRILGAERAAAAFELDRGVKCKLAGRSSAGPALVGLVLLLLLLLLLLLPPPCCG